MKLELSQQKVCAMNKHYN